MSRHSPAPPPLTIESRLAASKLGIWPLVLVVMAAAAPLTVVNGGATAGFAVTGIIGIPLAYLVVGGILALFTVGYVAMSSTIVNAGAFYAYIARGLGRPAGVAAAYVAIVAYGATMQVGLFGGFGEALASFASEELGVTMPWWGWASIACLLLAGLGGRRIDLNSIVLTVLLIAEIAVALVFAAVHLTHPENGEVSFATVSPGNLLAAGVGAALAIAIAGSVGFEGTAVFSKETRQPRRTVPRATYLAVGFIAALYAFCSWAMSVATGPDRIVQRATADGSELSFNLAAPFVPDALIILGHLLYVTSLFAALLAFQNTAARYFFALGREGVLPRWLGRTDPRTKAPKYGSWLQSAIAFTGIGVYAAQSWDPFTHMFFWLTVLGGFGVLILMTATSLAVVFYFSNPQQRNRVGAVRGIVAPALAFTALSGVLWVTLRQFATLLGVHPASPVRWQLPAVYAAAAVLGVGWALILRAAKPDVYTQIGLGATRTIPATARPVVSR
ncbi:APC family permease [Actinoplanes sp. URMC 104]|uniref:APC family permease n=1 Tax=Actinoplanes sp. URMC 104 TaxID=3423409 RepID=UPI003F1D04E6